MGSGLLFGACVLLSYGPALVTLIIAAGVPAVLGWGVSTLRLLVGVGLSAAVVVALPSLWGFAYWQA